MERIIITAGGIIVDDNRILLVKRGADKKAFPGAWTFPGGKLEYGENQFESNIFKHKRKTGEELYLYHSLSFLDSLV